MPKAQICPKCKRFILGDYCFTCKKDVTTMINTNIFEEIWKDKNGGGNV